MADYSNFFDLLGSGTNLVGNVLSAGNANQNNAQVQQGLGQNAGSLAQTIADLQAQLGQGRGISQDAYNQANTLAQQQNQQLQGNIDTMTANLNALSDPNSPYMQMARQRIERSDAAAGRRSQVGEREVQLAAMLADYVGKYAPGLNQSITGSRNQMATNTQTLADLYARMGQTNNAQQQALNQALQQQQQGVALQNTAGRGAANNALNTNMAALQAGLGVGKGLWDMFGSGGGGTQQEGAFNFIGNGGDIYGGFGSGITGGSLGSGSLGGFGSYDGANNFMGGGNLFGDSGGGGFSFGDDIWD